MKTTNIYVWAFGQSMIEFYAEFENLPAAMTFAIAAAGANGVKRIQIEDKRRNRLTNYERLIDGSMVCVGEEPRDAALPMLQ